MNKAQARRMMESFLQSRKLEDTEVTTSDGIQYILVAPNRSTDGSLAIVVDDIEYSASLMRKDRSRVRTISSVPYVSPIQKKQAILAGLREMWEAHGRTLSPIALDRLLTEINDAIAWLKERGVEVE